MLVEVTSWFTVFERCTQDDGCLLCVGCGIARLPLGNARSSCAFLLYMWVGLRPDYNRNIMFYSPTQLFLQTIYRLLPGLLDRLSNSGSLNPSIRTLFPDLGRHFSPC